MAEQLPINFQVPGESAIVTYDYVDWAEGTGIVVFYGSRVSIDATAANDKYILSRQAMMSSVESTSWPAASEFDFDVYFNVPVVIVGKAYIAIPIYTPTPGQVSQASVTVIHYDGTTETTLVAKTATLSLTGTAYGERILRVTIPLKKFKIGETLRLTFENTGVNTGQLFHNPLGGNANLPFTGGALKAYIPFRIER